MKSKISVFLNRFLLGYSVPSDCHFWIRADPVYLEADHQRVFMRGSVGIPLEKEKQADLLNKLNSLFKEDNLEISCITSTEWILKGQLNSPKLANITSSSPSACLHQDIKAFLPWGDNQAYWRRLLTECQMIMQAYDNNSLWFWRP